MNEVFIIVLFVVCGSYVLAFADEIRGFYYDFDDEDN